MRLIHANMHAVVEAQGKRALLALSLVLAHAATGAAQDSARAELHVDAEPRCATTESIGARVRARSSRIALAPGAPIALHVVIAPQPSGELAAELNVVWLDGRRSTRGLSAPSCAAAVDALAFLITLTLDPKSARAEETGPAPKRTPEAQPAPAPATPAPATDAPVSAPATDAPVSAPAAPEQASLPASNEREPEASSPHEPFAFSHAALGLAAHAALGPAPRAMPGLVLLAQLAWHDALPWAPLVQLRAGSSWLDTERAGGVAHFRLDAATLSACPIGVRASRLAAHACGTFELGSLSARGTDTYDPRSHARLWLSVGTELLLGLRVAGPLELQLGAGLFWPLRRDRFAFAPAVFHRVASPCAEAHAGLVLRFP